MLLARLALIVMVAAASRAALQAQTTAEGVTALVAGDFARAAAILRPIAESWPPRDRTAEFFLAAMYENGLGVPVDPLRACALYVRASSDASAPFSRVAQELLVEHQRSLGMDGFLTCLRLSSVGFDHGFQPVTFDLGPGHWISLDLEGATIGCAGKEKRVELWLARGGGARFLPVEHTKLRTDDLVANHLEQVPRRRRGPRARGMSGGDVPPADGVMRCSGPSRTGCWPPPSSPHRLRPARSSPSSAAGAMPSASSSR